MAIRQIVQKGDEILAKKARVVDTINDRIINLLEDMADTMHANNGAGLAAPQVGILKRIAVVDVGEGVIELINPQILEASGEVLDQEGCLSVPGIVGEVKRPKTVKVKALNRKGEEIELEGSDFLARAFCHEIDHLDGILFDERADKIINVE